MRMVEIPDQDDAPTPEELYEFFGMEFLLPRGDGYQRVTVSHRKQSDYGEIICRRNANLILYTRIYESVSLGGEVIEFYANRMAESIFTLCDTDGD